jgi:hypothetical protein
MHLGTSSKTLHSAEAQGRRCLTIDLSRIPDALVPDPRTTAPLGGESDGTRGPLQSLKPVTRELETESRNQPMVEENNELNQQPF